MSHLLTTPTARVAAILFTGRGADGTLGSDAQAHAIPSAQFRRSFAPLQDIAEPSPVVHRGVHLSWVQTNKEPAQVNPRNQKIITNHVLRVEIGYLTGSALTAHVYTAPATTESASASAQDPSLVAHSDGARIITALEWPELYQDGADDPAIIDVEHVGVVSTDRTIQPWLLLATIDFRVRLWGTRTGRVPA